MLLPNLTKDNRSDRLSGAWQLIKRWSHHKPRSTLSTLSPVLLVSLSVTCLTLVNSVTWLCLFCHVKCDNVQVITDKIRDDEESASIEGDWKFAAMVSRHKIFFIGWKTLPYLVGNKSNQITVVRHKKTKWSRLQSLESLESRPLFWNSLLYVYSLQNFQLTFQKYLSKH